MLRVSSDYTSTTGCQSLCIFLSSWDNGGLLCVAQSLLMMVSGFALRSYSHGVSSSFQDKVCTLLLILILECGASMSFWLCVSAELIQLSLLLHPQWGSGLHGGGDLWTGRLSWSQFSMPISKIWCVLTVFFNPLLRILLCSWTWVWKWWNQLRPGQVWT